MNKYLEETELPSIINERIRIEATTGSEPNYLDNLFNFSCFKIKRAYSKKIGVIKDYMSG